MSEVCTIADTDQFEAGKTVDACGFYGVSLLKYAGRSVQAPTGNASQIASWADSEYTHYDGPDTAANTNGMTMSTLEAVLGDAGLHYQVIASNEIGFHTDHLTIAYIRAWLALGYPVIISTAESAVYDLDLRGSPYAWDTTGYYHIIVATGFDGSAIYCHDTASIDSNGVRRGPRRYDANKLQAGLTSATAVVLPWLLRPTPDFDPIVAQQEASMYHFLSIAEQASWFKQTVAGHDGLWTCTQNGVVLGGDHLNYFRWNGGVAVFGLPLTAEIQLDAAHHPEATAVKYERCVAFFDPNHIYDSPVTDPAQPTKTVYRAHIESGPGLQLLAALLVPPTIDLTTAETACSALDAAILGAAHALSSLKEAVRLPS